MIGKIFITSSGYDPERGRHVHDPYLGPVPTLGACRPDIRKLLRSGDHIFVISGKVYGIDQFVMAGFEIASKINAREAYEQFPKQRLRKREDGQLTGNIIIDADGAQHELDNHNSFEERIRDYVVGRNLIALRTPDEIALGRKQTLEVLRDVLHKKGASPIEVVGRWGSRLTEDQIGQLRQWLSAIANRPG
ncbi:MAG TPA: hypothetical protein VES88_17340 [Gemmatimonadaceae bacterium]|nr:hypothetical protein [Gemmatimonadaceae bacterium]